MRHPTWSPVSKDHMPHALRRTALTTILIALVLPGSAMAALDVTRSGTVLTVAGSTTDATQIEIDDDGGVYVAGSEVGVGSSNGSCTDEGDVVSCGAANLTSLVLTLSGGGDDELTLGDGPFTTAAILTVNTGAGDDSVRFNGPQKVVANLGDGDDLILSGAGNDEAHGGPGDDAFSLGDGNDQAWGDEGNDFFDGGFERDGADAFDGGTDAPTTEDRWAGDTVSYAGRDAADSLIDITLPADSVATPTGKSGADAELDRFAHVENAESASDGLTTIVGNERNNRLIGFRGNETLSGGPGDDFLQAGYGNDRYAGGEGSDLIDARAAYEISNTEYYADGDAEINCGLGADAVRRDADDPEGFGCESQAPKLTETPRIMGQPNAGAALTVNRGKTFGIVDGMVTRWVSCPAESDLTGPDCFDTGEGPNYVPGNADLGRLIFARIELLWPFGEGDVAWSFKFGPIRTATGQAPSTQPPGGGLGGPGTGVPTTFAQAAAQYAQRKLGTGAFASNVNLGAGTATFEAPVAKGGVIKLKGSIVPVVSGVACEKACTVTVTGSIVLVPKAKKGAKKKAKYKTVKLAAQTVKIPAGQLGGVKLGATTAHRKLIKKARKAKATLAYSLKYADGSVRKAKKSYLLKVG